MFLRRTKVERDGSLAVVVLDVRLQHRSKMPFAQEEHPIEALGADRPDEPFGIGVGLGCPPRRAQDLDLLGADYLVEDGQNRLSRVMNQVADRFTVAFPPSVRFRAIWRTRRRWRRRRSPLR